MDWTIAIVIVVLLVCIYAIRKKLAQVERLLKEDAERQYLTKGFEARRKTNN